MPFGLKNAGMTFQAVGVQPIQVQTAKFSHVHLDIVGHLPCTKEGFMHLLTAVDRLTRWVEVLPLTATTAVDWAEAFIASGWLDMACWQLSLRIRVSNSPRHSGRS
jgi:hypothetical protein